MGKRRDKNNDAGTSTQNVPSKSPRLSKDLIEQITFFQMNDDASVLDFPSTLDSVVRKSIHQYATKVGLKSKSTGKGAFCCCR